MEKLCSIISILRGGELVHRGKEEIGVKWGRGRGGGCCIIYKDKCKIGEGQTIEGGTGGTMIRRRK